MKKNAQIFLVAVGVVILRCSRLRRAPQTTPSFTSKQTTPAASSTYGRGCQIFLRCIVADLDLIVNVAIAISVSSPSRADLRPQTHFHASTGLKMHLVVASFSRLCATQMTVF